MMESNVISASNLSKMLIYAFRLWGIGLKIDSSWQELDSPLDILALIFNQQIRSINSKGLYRDYRENIEDSAIPRGKILLSNTISIRSKALNQVSLLTDEFSANNQTNQVLLWVSKGLIRSNRINAESKKALKKSIVSFEKFSLCNPSPKVISSCLSAARRPEYRVALSIAYLFSLSGQVDPLERNDLSFDSEIFSEKILPRLFESFLREFYRYHLSTKVSGKEYTWSEYDSSGLNPKMKTDINIETQDELYIIDAKFYQSALKLGFDYDSSKPDSKKINSAHLYQLFTYLTYAAVNSSSKTVSGILLYPRNQYDIDHIVKTVSGDIRVTTIDCNQDWESLTRNLLDLVPSLREGSNFKKKYAI